MYVQVDMDQKQRAALRELCDAARKASREVGKARWLPFKQWNQASIAEMKAWIAVENELDRLCARTR